MHAEPFSGSLEEGYHLARLAAPDYDALQNRLANSVASHATPGRALTVLEIGTGDGVTADAILRACGWCGVVSVDHDPRMISRARARLAAWLDAESVVLINLDAREYLRQQEAAAFDLVVSALTFHNWFSEYRGDVLEEVHRVLKPGGTFVNADRYAQSPVPHHQTVVSQVSQFFDVFLSASRPDLLKPWILHLLEDEHPERLMTEEAAVEQLNRLGFEAVEVRVRFGPDAILCARRPREP
ncbi:MAG TPA: class I SAM-dependent methyltransferase [Longimicrobium sp.]|nr:class I SAM-dependent methyltransferase [Longimicrobium sp.]